MKYIKVIIISLSIFGFTKTIANPCCDCYNQFMINSYNLEVQAVGGILDCFWQNTPMDYYDGIQWWAEWYGLIQNGANPYYSMGVATAHSFFSWVSGFSSCSSWVLNQNNYYQVVLNSEYSSCMQPLSCNINDCPAPY